MNDEESRGVPKKSSTLIDVRISKLTYRDAGKLLIAFSLFIEIALFVWMARRGFDFTDESYYFLSYLYWRDLVGTDSFFGAYFELPFRMFGQSIPAIRVFGLILLLISSYYFLRSLFLYSNARDGLTQRNVPQEFLIAGMSLALLYFGYLSTLRAPSYNLLSLCSMLVSTGLLLSLLSGKTTRPKWLPLFYGVVIGVGGLAKATAGLLLVFFHLVFFLLTNANWQARYILRLLAFCFAGASLNFLMLQFFDPDWLSALREGVLIKTIDGSHDLIRTLNILRWDIQAVVPIFAALAGAGSLLIVAAARYVTTSMSKVMSVLIVLLIGAFVVNLIWGSRDSWLPLAALLMFLLWVVECVKGGTVRFGRREFMDLGVTALLFALPVAFSFGTDMPLLKHSQLAAVFPGAALLLRLYRVFSLGLLVRPALLICLFLLTLPALAIQVRAATDARFTYRQLIPLSRQNAQVRLGFSNDPLLVDETTRDTLQQVTNLAATAGFKQGVPVLDLTGDSPGLVYALGGRPVGIAWLWGGFPGSEAIAKHVLERVKVAELKQAWLLSSTDAPRAIKDWKQILDRQIGIDAYELVGTVYVRASYRKSPADPERVHLQLWRPREVSALNF